MMRAKMKVTPDAVSHAAELLMHLLTDGRTKLGAERGDTYAETVAGHRLLACRLVNGGVMVREISDRGRESAGGME